MALSPGFPGQPFVYLYFTQSGTGGDTNGSPAPLGNRVYRYTWNGSALVSPMPIAALPVTQGRTTTAARSCSDQTASSTW